MHFAIAIDQRMRQLKKDFKELKDKAKTDLKCASVMEVAALRGQFSSDPMMITRMEVYFSQAEFMWNGEVTIKKSALNYFRNFMKEVGSKESISTETFWKLKEIGEGHNRGFMSYGCAYPLSQEYVDRVTFKKSFASYEAAVEAQQEENAKIKDPLEVVIVS